MSRKSLDQTLAFIQEVDRARTHEDVCRALLAPARRFGFEHILAGTIPRPGASRVQQVGHVVLADWPEEWARRYFSHGYLFRDPAIRRVNANAAPFFWSELEAECAQDAAARRVMDEASDFDLKCGFTVPLVTVEGDVAGFPLAGAFGEASPEARGVLTLLATYALARSLQLRRVDEEEPYLRPSLSPRERETLQWAAEGLTDLEIGARMKITDHGVDRHLRAARRKLGTRNRTHAVAEAIRLGLVR
ncbi:autoinducer binding domain-containing protein [Salinarimonas sp. NSM]|uniref:autoinducer binding domain-containing protein n=1 Tax=Salinarimonas sp. NSM TaxID=3458003 RepID=UPI0040374D73